MKELAKRTKEKEDMQSYIMMYEHNKYCLSYSHSFFKITDPI